MSLAPLLLSSEGASHQTHKPAWCRSPAFGWSCRTCPWGDCGDNDMYECYDHAKIKWHMVIYSETTPRIPQIADHGPVPDPGLVPTRLWDMTTVAPFDLFYYLKWTVLLQRYILIFYLEPNVPHSSPFHFVGVASLSAPHDAVLTTVAETR